MKPLLNLFIKLFLPLLCLLLFAINAKTQNVAPYSKQANNNICSEFDGVAMPVDKNASRYLRKFCKMADIHDNFVLVGCREIEYCYAISQNGVLYVLCDSVFFERVKAIGFRGKRLPKTGVDWVALTILAHELGHHILQHTTNPAIRDKYTPVEMELQADEYAGSVMYRLGATLEQAQEAFNMSNIPLEASVTHPARSARKDAIAKGWNNEHEKHVAGKIL